VAAESGTVGLWGVLQLSSPRRDAFETGSLQVAATCAKLLGQLFAVTAAAAKTLAGQPSRAGVASEPETLEGDGREAKAETAAVVGPTKAYGLYVAEPQARDPHTSLYSCFICHSHIDSDFAAYLHGRLRAAGVRVWYAPEDMQGGMKLKDQIDSAIRVHDKLLLILSQASIQSEWVATEILEAQKREQAEGKRVLFPIRVVPLDPAITRWVCFDADSGRDLAKEVREYHIPDFSDWRSERAFERAFAGLLHSLRRDS
jgi:hypothetical protein